MITVDFSRLSIKPGFKILDIGCGSGRHTGAAYMFKNVVAVGADLNFNDICRAKKRLKLHDKLGEHGGGIWRLSVADITCFPFKDNYFDLVICSEVMEHIPDHESAAREVIRVLKPGSNLVVSVPRYWPERICWALSDEYYNASQGHVRIYKKKDLESLFEYNGVKMWACHFAHSLHTPYWWLKCLVGPTRDDSLPVNLYHRFLTWDIMKKPRITQFADYLLNPILGKSVVLYFKKTTLKFSL
ncbi:MAG: class I SAM-dependent methyltransferase [Deltaproteobacteria bacterium]|nr:class I SAM-dependent methyltransferase [Deltaproteobacteria bacterium]